MLKDKIVLTIQDKPIGNAVLIWYNLDDKTVDDLDAIAQAASPLKVNTNAADAITFTRVEHLVAADPYQHAHYLKIKKILKLEIW